MSTEETASWGEEILGLSGERAMVVTLVAALVGYLVARGYTLRFVRSLASSSKTQIDDMLVKHGVFTRLSLAVPAILIFIFAEVFDPYQSEVGRLALVAITLVLLFSASAFLAALNEILNSMEFVKGLPLNNYFHLIGILLYVVGFIVIIAIWTGKSPGLLLSGLGAMMAILLLIFKDTILSLVASVQITTKDLIRVGDWIEVPKYGADGDVVQITLHTVKVQNWDKTYTVIPTYKLLDEAFKNWRGMTHSGGRRIKRAINIDISTVKFLDEQTVERYQEYNLISQYIEEKLQEVDEYNRQHHLDTAQLINGRRLTNLGTFRAYAKAYLRNNSHIHKQMTFLVRQLEPGPEGIPLQIYVFTTDTDWVKYEDIQANIFDHLLAVVPLFDLKVFQQPAGTDFQKLAPAGEEPAAATGN